MTREEGSHSMNLRAAVFVVVILAGVSSVRAGLVITLSPSAPSDPAGYPGEIVQIEVYAQLDAGSPATMRVQSLQFDFSDTDPELLPTPLITHADTAQGPINFWDFSGTQVCHGESSRCGELHSIDGSLDADLLLNTTYQGLTADASRQLTLYRAIPTRVGLFQVTVPVFTRDSYLIDVLNADDTDDDRGAELRAGFFGTSQGTIWRANDGQITGGQLLFVIPEPATLSLLLLGTAFFTTKTRRKNGGVQ